MVMLGLDFPSPLSRGGVRGGAAPLRHAKSPTPAPPRERRGGENSAERGNPRYLAAFSALTSSVTAASEDLISPWKNFVTTSW